MSTSKEDLLMFGATGYIGTYIIEAILKAKDSFGRIAIFTSSDTAGNKARQLEKLKELGVEIITGDVTKKEDVLMAYEGVYPTPFRNEFF
jgi:uncharacterized protein YbjT (DUF2867 family)